ncbi:hypothetical protein [Coxiella burnetii]|uniref:hypothetical protein n=1 Tax=Coxiella burnetii TaxID=777 RepID=UPI003F4AA2E8
MDPPLLSTISFDEKKAVAFVYPASQFKLATIGALMNYARLMLIGLSASQSHRMNQLNQPQVFTLLSSTLIVSNSVGVSPFVNSFFYPRRCLGATAIRFLAC